MFDTPRGAPDCHSICNATALTLPVTRSVVIRQVLHLLNYSLFGHRAYCTKLPRKRNSPISRAIQAAGHEARRNEKREAQIAERREVEARFVAENQKEARDAAERKKAAIEEAERIFRQLLAEKKKTPVQPSSSQQLATTPNSRDQEDEFILQISEEVPEQ
ncbi:hypothetical protein DAPPUDRAFT_258624 [Daphnia pulex]|uniref:Uncharacterized protein n=1 Tax=Daphnia pulex TaxID=6669 RepID=E9HFQ1_DAPPU|nr:hypothetical protein DAPPUDRAFT_258624 [Daphnia pulex]|eukprot:EFX69430.1 hypothetical protein DAPPUDRAFT_258624 [Daphnia pulex]